MARLKRRQVSYKSKDIQSNPFHSNKGRTSFITDEWQTYSRNKSNDNVLKNIDRIKNNSPEVSIHYRVNELLGTAGFSRIDVDGINDVLEKKHNISIMDLISMWFSNEEDKFIYMFVEALDEYAGINEFDLDFEKADDAPELLDLYTARNKFIEELKDSFSKAFSDERYNSIEKINNISSSLFSKEIIDRDKERSNELFKDLVGEELINGYSQKDYKYYQDKLGVSTIIASITAMYIGLPINRYLVSCYTAYINVYITGLSINMVSMRYNIDTDDIAGSLDNNKRLMSDITELAVTHLVCFYGMTECLLIITSLHQMLDELRDFDFDKLYAESCELYRSKYGRYYI